MLAVKVKEKKVPHAKKKGWDGYDLDGVWALYDGWRGMYHIGAPIPEMVQQLKNAIAAGVNVKIFTARVGPQDHPEANIDIARRAIEDWCEEHIGVRLEVTATKDFACNRIFDDLAISVEKNTGRITTEGYYD